MNACRVYWGSHGCKYERGHSEPHECRCCVCDGPCEPECVAKPPYYGDITRFYGEDSEALGLPQIPDVPLHPGLPDQCPDCP